MAEVGPKNGEGGWRTSDENITALEEIRARNREQAANEQAERLKQASSNDAEPVSPGTDTDTQADSPAEQAA
jgi:hypothetical protein